MTAIAAASRSILVADDEEGIRKMLHHWLGKQGHLVQSAGSAEEAKRLMRTWHFDLVITDVVMPDGDGFELITALRNAQPSARILAISGGGKYLERGDCLKMARGLGAHAIVTKPFSWEELDAGVEEAMTSSGNSASGLPTERAEPGS